jgi:predicted naringenin-chalcone synthase
MQAYRREALPLALQAAQQALSESGCQAREVTHVVVASCSGFSAPGVDIGLVQQLGLSPSTQRTIVGFMGCHGGFNALQVASSILGANPAAVVLVCAVELCSLHHFYGWDPEKVVANALFADGAAAALCRANSPDDSLRLVRHGSVLVADTADAMTWSIGDDGFEMTLSQEVPALIEKHLGPWLDEFLAQEELSVHSIGSWAIHPGGPRILDACRRALQLPEAALACSRSVLADHGNMSSATIFFVLDRLRRQNAPRPIVALGFGPGLSIEAMILE